MFVHDVRLTFPRLRQVNLSTGRCYVAEEGENKGLVLPSITRILGKKEKPQLEAWKARLGPQEAARQSAIATVQGSALHKLMECHLNNQGLPRFGPNVGELWQHLHRWLDDHITAVYAQEQDVASFLLGGAGRLDLLAEVDGDIAIVDAKTSKRPKRDEWIEDYFIQGTFYAMAVFEATGQQVKRIVVPISNPETGIQIFETTPKKHYRELMVRIEDFYKSYTVENSLDTQSSPPH
jgi:genome maintenance exonuclease 1